MTTRIFFNDESTSEKYKKLQNSSKLEDIRIFNEIIKAIDILEEDPFSGIQIPKRQVPKKYKKIFRPDNLWKYDLKTWRLIYWISSDDEGQITLLIDWMNHKQYDKLFGYNSS